MKLEFEINKKVLKDQIVREVARQILHEYEGRGVRLWGRSIDVRETLQKKAMKLLEQDEEFDVEIKKELKKQFRDKKIRANVVKDILREKLEDND